MKIPSLNFCLVDEAKKGEVSKTYLGQLLTFLGVFLVSTLLQSIIPCVYVWDEMMNAMSQADINTSDSDEIYSFYQQYDFGIDFLILSLLCTALGIVVTFLYCRGFERRRLSSLGFVKRGAVKSYFSGMLAGFSMFSVSVLLCVVFGGGTLSFQQNVNIGIIFAYLGGFIVQGMYEEVIFRGYFFVSTASAKPVGYAIIANSVLFSLAHGLNTGVTVTAFVNIALFGVFMSLCMILTENIWFIGALHSIWNFSQGNIFGVSTSGMNVNASVFTFNANGDELLNGGSFGLEGSIVVTIVLAISIAVVFVLIKRKSARKTLSDSPVPLRADE